MWKIEEYNGTQDLNFFFAEAEKKKFYNNSSKEMLLDSLEKEEDSRILI